MTSPTTPSKPLPQPFPTAERVFIVLLACVTLGLRLLFACHFRIDSDEPQHLHVVWAWTQGLLPYRDVFDNHAPVFQALCAPLFHLLGVRADILLPMRLAMVPLFALTIFCVWKISASIFNPRIAWWTAVIAAFFPPFFLTSVEFRPDQLWATVWLVTLTVCVSGTPTKARAFVAGLLLGLAFSVSMKTSVLAAALVLGCAGTLLMLWCAGKPIGALHCLKNIGLAATGLVVIPSLVVLYFVWHGAVREMLYCVILHNVPVEPAAAGKALSSFAMWIAWLPGEFFGAWIIWKLPMKLSARARLAFVFLTAAFFYTTLVCFWPIREAETFLPFYPAIAISGVPVVLWLAGLIPEKIHLPKIILPLAIVSLEMLLIFKTQSPFVDLTADKTGMVADTLKLTDDKDFVMDSKGETIYRKRPFYYVLEMLTYEHIKRHLIQDDIARRLVETRTPVATTFRMPGAAKKFIEANYIPIAFRLSVLGKIVQSKDPSAGEKTTFEVVIPNRYTLVCESGKIAGNLDGRPFDGPRELAAGIHEFSQTEGSGRVALIWSQAVERGYSPFAEIKKDCKTAQD